MTIPGYHIDAEIRTGTPVEVHRGRRVADSMPIVVRSVRLSLPEAADKLRRYAEICAAQRFSRTANVVEIVSVGDRLHLVLEDVGQTTLATLMEMAPLSIAARVDIAQGIFEALDELHSHQIIHSDLHPGNIIVDPIAHTVSLIDLGLARRTDAPARTSHATAIQGDVRYISPEQTGRTTHRIDTRSDLYAAGIILYQLLAGRLPFAGDDTIGIIHSHLTVEPTPLLLVSPGIPAVLSGIVELLLKKQPEDRYQTAYGVVADLAASKSAATTEMPTLRSKDVRDWYDRLALYTPRDEYASKVSTLVQSIISGTDTTVLITGAAGSGKTTLTQELMSALQQSGFVVFHGDFDHAADIPLSAVTTIVRSFSSWVLQQPDSDLEEWRTLVLQTLGPSRSLVQGVIPTFGDILGALPEEPTQVTTGREAQIRLVSSLRLFFDEMARKLRYALVLENLHWADPASIDVISALLGSSQRRGRSVVLTLRSDDPKVTNGHKERISTLLSEDTSMLRIDVEPMSDSEIECAVRHAFGEVAPSTLALAQHVRQETGGIPLYVEQFSTLLVERKGIWFDRTIRQWCFDQQIASKIEAVGQTDFILQQRFSTFSRIDLDVITVHAALGSSITETDLYAVIDDAAHIERAIQLAEAAGIIRRGEAGGRTLLAFVHDHLRAFAESLCPPGRRLEVLSKHALLLAERWLGEQANTALLFTAADQIARIQATDTTPDNAPLFLNILLVAGKRARSSGALDTSTHLLRRAVGIANHHHLTDRTLLYELHLALGEGLGNIGRFEEAAHQLTEAFRFASTALEKAGICAVKVHLLDIETRYEEAVRVGREGLGYLGIRIPRSPSLSTVLRSIGKAWLRQSRLTIETIRSRPQLNNPSVEMAIRLLELLQAPSFNLDVKLFTCVQMSRADLVFKHGHNDGCVDTYATFATIMLSVKAYNLAARYADLSIELSEKSADLGARSSSKFIPGCTITFWVRDVQESLNQLDDASELAELAGNQANVAYACGVYIKTLLFAGRSPHFIAAEMERMIERLLRTYQHHQDIPRLASYYHATVAQFLVTFFPTTVLQRQTQDIFSRADSILGESLRSSDMASVCLIQQLNATSALLNADLDEMGRCLDVMKNSEQGMLVLTSEIEYAVLRVIHIGLLYRSQQMPPAVRKTLRTLLRKLDVWEQRIPNTIGCRRLLARAFESLSQGNQDECLRGIDAAVAEAHRAENEIVSFIAKRCREIVDGSFVRDVPTPTTPAVRQTRSSSDSTSVSQMDLDIESVLRAASVIAGEINQDELMKNLLRIVAQHSGADEASLVLVEGGVPQVRASFHAERLVAEALAVDLKSSKHICVPATQVALRRATHVLYIDVRKTELSHDPFVKSTGTLSLLVYPIKYRSSVIGALHLTNRSVTGAFLERHLGFLDLLSGHIAGALENARLYSELRETLHSTERFVPREFLESLGIDSIRNVSMGDAVMTNMTVFFADIRRFTTLSEQLTVNETFSFLNSYLETVAPCISGNGGFIDKYIGDAVMALFPGNPSDAVRAAVGALKALSTLNTERAVRGFAPIEVGIGIHTGEVMLGTVGSAERLDTTVIGDTVNVASRLENLSKERGIAIVISDEVRSACTENGIRFTELGTETIRGRSKPITAFEVQF